MKAKMMKKPWTRPRKKPGGSPGVTTISGWRAHAVAARASDRARAGRQVLRSRALMPANLTRASVFLKGEKPSDWCLTDVGEIRLSGAIEKINTNWESRR